MSNDPLPARFLAHANPGNFTRTLQLFILVPANCKQKINPNYCVGRGAHAPRVRFCAPTRKTPPAQIGSQPDPHTTSTRRRTRGPSACVHALAGASSDTPAGAGRVRSPIRFFGISAAPESLSPRVISEFGKSPSVTTATPNTVDLPGERPCAFFNWTCI